MFTIMDEETGMIIDSWYNRNTAEEEMAFLILECGVKAKMVVSPTTAQIYNKSYCLDNIDDKKRRKKQ